MRSDLWIPALISLAAAGAPSSLAVWASRRRNRADTEATITSSAIGVLTELRTELTRREAACNQRIAEVRAEMTAKIGVLEVHIGDLEGMVRTLGGVPPDHHRIEWWRED